MDHYRVKDSTVKLELASQPWNFFRVLVYESVQAWLMVQSGCSSRLRNNSTRKSMALACKILSKQKSHTWHADQVATRSDKTKRNTSWATEAHLCSLRNLLRSCFELLPEPWCTNVHTLMDLNNTCFPVSNRRGSSQVKLKRKKQLGTPRAPEVKRTKQEAHQSKVAIDMNYHNIDNWKTTLTPLPSIYQHKRMEDNLWMILV